jgi:hypothetical protein
MTFSKVNQIQKRGEEDVKMLAVVYMLASSSKLRIQVLLASSFSLTLAVCECRPNYAIKRDMI